MLKKRIITGLIFGSVAIYLLSFSPLTYSHMMFAVLALIVITLAGAEYLSLVWNSSDEKKDQELPHPAMKSAHLVLGAAYGTSVLFFYLFLHGTLQNISNAVHATLLWVFVAIFLSSFLLYRYSHDLAAATQRFFFFLAGFLYISVPTICLLNMTYLQFPYSFRNSMIYFVLSTIIAGDVGAFFIGTKFGKHKMVPLVSPKKSVEGALGGLFTSAVMALVAGLFFHFPVSPFVVMWIGVFTAMAGQFGDLVESALKRVTGYKDSGTFLPGHGGFLDRIDSLVMGVPVAYLLFEMYLPVR